MEETPGVDGLDFKDAWNVAHYRAPMSNLARCYISAMQALMRIKGQTLSMRPDLGLITDTCEHLLEGIERD